MPLTFAKDPETFERDYAALTTREAPPAAAARPAARSGDADGEIIDDFTTVGKGGKTMQFTSESIFKNLQAVQEARGKKVIYSFSLHTDVV